VTALARCLQANQVAVAMQGNHAADLDACYERIGFGAPSGLFAREIRFPGLKPWAKFSCPFGAKDSPEDILSSRHSSPGLDSSVLRAIKDPKIA
jgi:hypothetical protein